MTIDEVPKGLHALEYARKICEECLRMPAAESNLKLVADCLTAIARSTFPGKEEGVRMATVWLWRRIEVAKMQGQNITSHWLRNAEYNDVEKPKDYPSKPKYEHYGQGYGTQDMLWLFHRYQAKRKTLPNRGLTDSEVEQLLVELDKKRGGAPDWRLQ